MMKKVIITGANSGIGKEAAVQFAEAGWHVIIACRSRNKGEVALREIRQRSSGGLVELTLVDMSLQSSVRELAAAFLAKYDTLDVLIHNAAIFDIRQKERQITPEGIEKVWATNHLGPVLMTELLMPALNKAEQARIITVSSKGLISMPGLKVNLEDPEFKQRKFSMVKAYYQSKLAQLMYTHWLSEKLKNTSVTVNAIRVPSVQVDVEEKFPDLSPFLKWVYTIKSRFAMSPRAMAEIYFWLATAEDLSHTTGAYFDEKKGQLAVPRLVQESNGLLMDLSFKYLKNPF